MEAVEEKENEEEEEYEEVEEEVEGEEEEEKEEKEDIQRRPSAAVSTIPPSHRQARRRRRKFNAGRVLVRKTLPAWTLLAWASRRNRASPHAARPPPRGLHSSTSQLDLSRVCHQETPDTPYTPLNTPLTRATQPLMYTP